MFIQNVEMNKTYQNHPLKTSFHRHKIPHAMRPHPHLDFVSPPGETTKKTQRHSVSAMFTRPGSFSSPSCSPSVDGSGLGDQSHKVRLSHAWSMSFFEYLNVGMFEKCMAKSWENKQIILHILSPKLLGN